MSQFSVRAEKCISVKWGRPGQKKFASRDHPNPGAFLNARAY